MINNGGTIKFEKDGTGKMNYSSELADYLADVLYEEQFNEAFSYYNTKNTIFFIYDGGEGHTYNLEWDKDQYFYQPQAILWNSPPNNQQFRINNLGNVTSYQIDWYHFETGVYIKSDIVSSNGVIKLEYPPLIVTQGSNKSVIDNPVVWFVGHPFNNGKSLKEGESIDQSIETEFPKNTIYPNPFADYFFVDSKEEDTFILQAIDGTIIERYKLSKGETKVLTLKLSKGIYIGTLQNQTQSFKIIKL